MDNTLYHLTSLNNLLGILKSEAIRLSDSFKANDRYESRYQLKAIYKALKQICTDYEYRQIKKLLMMNVNCENNDLRMYLFCLSKGEIHKKCWKRYGDRKKGAAIEFDKNKLEQILLATSFSHTKDNQIVRLEKVCYDIKQYSKTINKIINDNRKKDYSIFETAKELRKVYPLFKRQKWRYEKECRILMIESNNFDSIKCPCEHYETPLIFVADNHYVINLRKLIATQVITKIIPGTKVKSEAIKEIENLLEEKGFNKSLLSSDNHF